MDWLLTSTDLYPSAKPVPGPVTKAKLGQRGLVLGWVTVCEWRVCT